MLAQKITPVFLAVLVLALTACADAPGSEMRSCGRALAGTHATLQTTPKTGCKTARSVLSKLLAATTVTGAAYQGSIHTGSTVYECRFHAHGYVVYGCYRPGLTRPTIQVVDRIRIPVA